MAESNIENAIGRFMAITTPEITATTSFGTSSVIVKRIGNIVYLEFRTYDTSNAHSVTSSTVLCQLPIGYRPPTMVHFTGIGCKTTDFKDNSAVLFAIGSNGEFTTTYSGTYYQLWGCVTYALGSLP